MTERNDLHQACKNEGLLIMQDVFDTLLDRDEVTVEQIAEYLDHHSVQSLYDAYIGPAIDRVGNAIAGGP